MFDKHVRALLAYNVVDKAVQIVGIARGGARRLDGCQTIAARSNNAYSYASIEGIQLELSLGRSLSRGCKDHHSADSCAYSTEMISSATAQRRLLCEQFRDDIECNSAARIAVGTAQR